MIVKWTKNIILGRVPVTNFRSGIVKMTNLHTDEMAFHCSLTKIGTDENKAIYSIVSCIWHPHNGNAKWRTFQSAVQFDYTSTIMRWIEPSYLFDIKGFNNNFAFSCLLCFIYW